MSNAEYYKRWLKLKEHFEQALAEDHRIQELAVKFIGIKPQATAVEIVASAYCKYCEIFNRLCDCYDQMEQVQRRPYIKKIIDAITCRILELKTTLEEVEVFEFTYTDNALQQMLMVPDNVQILCPFFYPFEIREHEMQYIIDQIFAGNRIGDPPTKLSNADLEHNNEENINYEENVSETSKRRLMGDESIVKSIQSKVLSPKELEELRLKKEYEDHINNIQRMERSRYVTREKVKKYNKDVDLYLELSGSKKPPARKDLQLRASKLIQYVYRKYMKLKRDHARENKLKLKLGMTIQACKPPSAILKLEDVKEQRRKFRQQYYDKWMAENVKENSRILRLREGDIMEDISEEIRQWYREWYNSVRLFDEFPWPEEGGSVLVVSGQTFTINEFINWKTEEEKRLKAEAGAPKSKEQIKADKIAAKLEKKRLQLEAIEREKKRLLDYKKQRLNPDNDPGVYIPIGNLIEPLDTAWSLYENQWKSFDSSEAPQNVLKGYIMEMVTENAYKDVQLQLRPIVDEVMKIELNLLKNSLKMDYAAAGILKPPQSRKRKKPKNIKPPKPDKVSPAVMFQALVDQGIIQKYPQLTLDDFWGDRNYAAADLRAVQWTPLFPPPCIGDVREQIRTRCLLTLGSDCPKAARAQLLVGPKSSGKRTLVYAIASETNSILIDLSPMNVYDKFPGPKNLKTMFTYVTKISKLMQPTIILVDNADKLFYKKVPKEEKAMDPTRLSKDFFKEIIKNIQPNDKILVLGTASEPWVAKSAALYKTFPNQIVMPRTDYGSITYILTKLLMTYHGVSRDFNVHSTAQVLRGYDINSIRQAIANLMNGYRVASLYHKPLNPREIVNSVIEYENSIYTGIDDYDLFIGWYESFSPMGKKNLDYMAMLASQLNYKMKTDKKSKKS